MKCLTLEPDVGPALRLNAPQDIGGFERFFRLVANVKVEPQDVVRYRQFVSRKLQEMLERAQGVAEANDRTSIRLCDLAIPNGLQRSMDAYRSLEPILDLEMTARVTELQPPHGGHCPHEIEQLLPVIAGGLAIALGRSFRIVDARLQGAYCLHWDQAFDLMELVL
jgi:hypothetical protein